VAGIGALALAAAVAAALAFGGTESAAAPEYRTANVDRGPIVTGIPASGTISAIGTVNIMAQVSGQLSEVNVDYNAPVTAGMQVARLDPEACQNRVSQAEADLTMARAKLVSADATVERARTDIRSSESTLVSLRAQLANAQLALDAAARDLGRQSELFARNVLAQVAVRDAETKLYQARTHVDQTNANITGQQATLDGRRSSLIMAQAGVDSAKATILQRQAALSEAKAELERTIIRAPSDGVVIARNVEVGQSINANATQPVVLFTTAKDLARMEVLVSVDESDIGKVQNGQPLTFTVSSYPGRTFAVRVSQVRLAAKTVQNVVTYTVVATVDNSDLSLLPGMSASGNIVLAQRNVLRVPNTALRFAPPGAPAVTNAQAPLQNGGRAGRVFLQDETGKLQMVALAVGTTDGRFTEVLAGNIDVGQTLIVGTTADAAAPTGLNIPGLPPGAQMITFGPGDAPPPGFAGPGGGALVIRVGA